jgi:hypothetical protein
MKKKRCSAVHVSGMKAATAMKSGIVGTVFTVSISACSTVSIQPPKYPQRRR